MNTTTTENPTPPDALPTTTAQSEIIEPGEIISILSEEEAQKLDQEQQEYHQVRGVHLPEIDLGTELLADTNLGVPQMLVAGILHKGTKGVLAASSKVGKTWLMLDLAVSVATGTPFLKFSTTQGRVLFVNFEIHRTFLRDRLQLVTERKKQNQIDQLDVWNLRGKRASFEDLLDELLERIQKTPYSLIILDPIYKAMVGQSENTASGVGKLCANIERLVDAAKYVYEAQHRRQILNPSIVVTNHD